MKRLGAYLLKTLIRGALIVLPVYLAVLLLLKAAQSVIGIVHPIAKLLPPWFPARRRVHPLDVPFTQAIKAISRWGTGWKELMDAMKRERPAT